MIIADDISHLCMQVSIWFIELSSKNAFFYLIKDFVHNGCFLTKKNDTNIIRGMTDSSKVFLLRRFQNAIEFANDYYYVHFSFHNITIEKCFYICGIFFKYPLTFNNFGLIEG